MVDLQFDMRAEQRAHDIVGSPLRYFVNGGAAFSGGNGEASETGWSERPGREGANHSGRPMHAGVWDK